MSQALRRLPEGWHSVTPRIVVEDASAFVAFLKEVFHATAEVRGDAPAIVRIGDSQLMVSAAGERDLFLAFLYVYVDDVDAVFKRALNAGAIELEEVWDTPYGDRRGMVKDPWGNVWQVATPIAQSHRSKD